MYLGSLLVSGLFFPWEACKLALSYSRLSIYSLPAITYNYNYPYGLACVLSGRAFIELLYFSVAQVAIDACLVPSNGCLHI